MSNKNFVSNDDAVQVLTPYANRIKAATPLEITYEEFLQLTPEEQNNGNYIVSNYPGGGQSTNPQADWNQTNVSADDYIKNKPELGTAAAKDSTDAITSQSTDLIESGAVYDALALKANSADLGTAAAKDYTDNVRPGSHDLVESNAVYSAINNAMSSIYHVRGDITCAELTSSLLIAANVGNVYELSDSGTTTNLFIQGAGVPLAVGDNVGIIQAGESTYLFNKMAGAFDMHDYQKKDLTTPITIEGTSYTTVEGLLGAINDAKLTRKPAAYIESESASETYATYCARVDTVLATMAANEIKIVKAYPPDIYGKGAPICVLYKLSDNYAGLYSIVSYDFTAEFKMIKKVGVWQPIIIEDLSRISSIGDGSYAGAIASLNSSKDETALGDRGNGVHSNSPIRTYLFSLDSRYKYAAFGCSWESSAVTDRASSVAWTYYYCVRQAQAWLCYATQRESNNTWIAYIWDTQSAGIAWTKIQKELLASAISVEGVSCTTVEGALANLSERKLNGVATTWISAASASETYEDYCDRVDAVLDTMADNTWKLVSAYPPGNWGGGTHVALLYRSSATYASMRTLTTYTVGDRFFNMRKSAGTWAPYEQYSIGNTDISAIGDGSISSGISYAWRKANNTVNPNQYLTGTKIKDYLLNTIGQMVTIFTFQACTGQASYPSDGVTGWHSYICIRTSPSTAAASWLVMCAPNNNSPTNNLYFGTVYASMTSEISWQKVV